MRALIIILVITSGLGALGAVSPAYAWYDRWGRWHPNYYRHPPGYYGYVPPPGYYYRPPPPAYAPPPVYVPPPYYRPLPPGYYPY